MNDDDLIAAFVVLAISLLLFVCKPDLSVNWWIP